MIKRLENEREKNLIRKNQNFLSKNLIFIKLKSFKKISTFTFKIFLQIFQSFYNF